MNGLRGIVTSSKLGCIYLTVLSPLVLAADLLLLLGGEVVGNVEGLADLLWRLALDHVGDGLASNVEEGFDIEIVGSLRVSSQHWSKLWENPV